MLTGEGIIVKAVAKELNDQLEAMTVLSDGLAFDSHWLSMIFTATEVKSRFNLQDAYQWLGKRVRDGKLKAQATLHSVKAYEHRKGRNHNPLAEAKLLVGSIAGA